MSGYPFRSCLAPFIAGLIEQKRSNGFCYDYEEWMLARFDDFCVANGYDDGRLTRELVMAWAVQRSSEGKNYRNQRVSIIRQVALYMASLNVPVYIPRSFESADITAPYILSTEELNAFFQVVDKAKYRNPRNQRFSLEYSVLFRLYYCCGMRLAEACFLKTVDVDLTNGRITVIHSKGDKDRVVYIAPDLLMLCRKYDFLINGIMPAREWFFPGKRAGQPFCKTGLDAKFAEFWGHTSFAGHVDKKPTIHSLRHTFVVEKINEWMRNGDSFQALVPYLSKYLGHASADETHYYYHLTYSAFGIIRGRDSAVNLAIPEVRPFEE